MAFCVHLHRASKSFNPSWGAFAALPRRQGPVTEVKATAEALNLSADSPRLASKHLGLFPDLFISGQCQEDSRSI